MIDEEVLNKWRRVSPALPLWHGMSEENEEYTIALLENQRIHNESLYDVGMDNTARFKRISIPLVVRIMRGCVKKGIQIKSDLRDEAKAWRTGVKGWHPTLEQKFHPKHCLDKEADRTAEIAQELVDAIANRTFAPNFYFLGITIDEGEFVIYYDDK